MSAKQTSRVTPLIGFVAISIAVVGYFTGLQSPMPPLTESVPLPGGEKILKGTTPIEEGVIPATRYSSMSEVTRNHRYQTRLTSLKSTFDPLAEIKIAPEEKLAALLKREQNRAFNGAPPTIPHPIDQRSDVSCLACHKEGAITKSLRIPRMSHELLLNCTQCHVEGSSQHMAAKEFRENDFAGLPAPTEGPRSFKGAPPQIPHTTWMRSDCMSCHGYAGLQGIRTTHPWRSSCQQCHTPSASQNQTLLAEQPQFLPGPKLKQE